MNAAMEYVSNKAYETLVIRAQDGDETAMVEILDDFEYRVEAVARQVVHRCRRANILDFDDLKQEGYAAIVRAVHEYSPDDDFNFTARVVMSIYWSAWGAVWNASWLSRSASAILKASRSDESLTFEEIAERAGCTVGRVRAVLAAAVVPVSLDCPLSDDRDDSHERHDVVPSSEARRPTEDAVLAAIEVEERKAAVEAAMQKLRDQDRCVFERHLDGVQYAEIAEEIGTTRDTISHLLVRVRKQLRAALAEWRNEATISYRGVYARHSKSWVAHIKRRINGVKVKVHLGTFRTAREAAQAYDAAALKYFGEKAQLNFPTDLETKNKEQVAA